MCVTAMLRRAGLTCATMVEANQVTLAVADLMQPYVPRVPVQVTRLDYFGRELEIWSQAGMAARVDSAVHGLGHEWDAVQSPVAARDPAVAPASPEEVT